MEEESALNIKIDLATMTVKCAPKLTFISQRNSYEKEGMVAGDNLSQQITRYDLSSIKNAPRSISSFSELQGKTLKAISSSTSNQ